MLRDLTLNRFDCKILILVQQRWAVVCPVVMLIPVVCFPFWLSPHQTIIRVALLYV